MCPEHAVLTPCATLPRRAQNNILHAGFLRRKQGRSLRLAALLSMLALCPSAWASLCEDGKQQSPIDITHTTSENLAPLVFTYRATAPTIANDGHTVRVRLGGGNRLRIGEQHYRLEQFHFHSPGGDQIAGEEFAMAVHLLHKSPLGQLLAIEVLYRVGAPDTLLDGLLPLIPARPDGEHRLANMPVDPAALLPPALGYYRYTGSLTAAPCTQGVLWIVLKEVRTVSAEQLRRYQSLFPPAMRPVQPLHGRTVAESR